MPNLTCYVFVSFMYNWALQNCMKANIISTCLDLFLYNAAYLPRKGFFFAVLTAVNFYSQNSWKVNPQLHTHTHTRYWKSDGLSPLSCKEQVLLLGRSIGFIQLSETRFIRCTLPNFFSFLGENITTPFCLITPSLVPRSFTTHIYKKKKTAWRGPCISYLNIWPKFAIFECTWALMHGIPAVQLYGHRHRYCASGCEVRPNCPPSIL